MAGTRDALKRIASRLEGAVEGVACAGTKLEAKTYSVNGKAFLFVSATDPATIRFKVANLAGAAKKAGAEVGAGGWAKLVLDGMAPGSLEDWIAESHALMAKGNAPAQKRAAAGRRRK